MLLIESKFYINDIPVSEAPTTIILILHTFLY